MHKSLVIVVALLASTGPVLAGTSTDPEIEDERGDVDVQHLVEADALSHIDASEAEIEASGDVVKAWVHDESPRAFTITIELAEIPDEAETDGPLVEVWTHEQIREGEFHTRSAIGNADSGDPLSVDHDLFLDETKLGSLSGSLDTEENRLSLRLAKADVRDPGEGDALSGFYVTTHVPETGAVLDYAPGTARESVPDFVEAQTADPTDLALAVDAEFGRSYSFQSFDQGDSELSVDATPSSREIQAGEQAEFAIRVMNQGGEEEDVSLDVLDAPQGWNLRLQPNSLTVPASGSQTASLFVTPANNADGHELIEVGLEGENGAQLGVVVSAIAVSPGGDDRSAGGSAGDGGTQTSNDGDRSAGQSGSEDGDGDGAGEADGDETAGSDEAGPGADGDEQEAQSVAFPALVLVLAAAIAAVVRQKAS